VAASDEASVTPKVASLCSQILTYEANLSWIFSEQAAPQRIHFANKKYSSTILPRFHEHVFASKGKVFLHLREHKYANLVWNI
jgi:hypothetical protein